MRSAKHSQLKKNALTPTQTQRSHRHVFWVPNKKPNWRKLDEKGADGNPVYRIFKNQRDTKTILNFILGSEPRKKPLIGHFRSKSQMYQSLRDSFSEQKFKKSKSINQRQTFREKAVKIMIKSKKVSQELQTSKRRISILDRFNKRVDKYCNSLPDNNQEGQDQQPFPNENLMKLCNQDIFPTDDLYRRASSFIHYQQPKIPQSKLKKLKEKYRLNTTNSVSNTQPFAKLLALNIA